MSGLGEHINTYLISTNAMSLEYCDEREPVREGQRSLPRREIACGSSSSLLRVNSECPWPCG